jgi:23S rRNA pseudouridine1911/1915/1917 synthase
MPKKIQSKRIIVTANDLGKRLDVFLCEKLKISRSQIQKMIEQNHILINDRLPKKPGDMLKTGNVVTWQKRDLDFSDEQSSKNTTPDKQLKAKKNIQPSTKLPVAAELTKKIKIIATDSDYLVVEKPTGLLSHPTMAEEADALSTFLLKKYPEIKNVGENKLRPGIVHRLDKEASGLLVVARTQKMFNHLKEQFKKRTIEKEYIVLVHGQVAKDEGEINFPIARSETTDRMAARPLSSADTPLQEGEKQAITEFFVLKRFVNFTLLSVKIHTGRMHQIRVHFLAYNHPVVGDPLYTQKKRKNKWDIKLGRLFLHCTKLVFTDLKNKACAFESELPSELTDFLNLLR